MSAKIVKIVQVFSLLLFTLSPLALPRSAQANEVMEVVASGLNNPRGLDFGPDGTLYIAEAGLGGDGPCIIGPEGEEVCIGLTGSVTRVKKGVQERFITGLPSLASEGGFASSGPHDVAAHVRNLEILVGLGGNPTARALLDAEGENLGHLFRAHFSGAFIDFVDVSEHESLENPDGGTVDSNPYSLDLATPAKRIVADAGANALLQVAANGRIDTLAVFPDRMVLAPSFLGLPPGTMIPMQSVPNAVTAGPDGAYYVGELTGFPFPVGGANVYRVVAGQAPEVFASGFTNIIDLTFDKDGNLYVLEITANGLLSGDLTGALIKMAAGSGASSMIASAGLVAPSSVAVGPDGMIYISNFGIFPGIGQVIRLSSNNVIAPQAKFSSEPSASLARQVLGMFGESVSSAAAVLRPGAFSSPKLFLPTVRR